MTENSVKFRVVWIEPNSACARSSTSKSSPKSPTIFLSDFKGTEPDPSSPPPNEKKASRISLSMEKEGANRAAVAMRAERKLVDGSSDAPVADCRINQPTNQSIDRWKRVEGGGQEISEKK
eukprot:NODE_6018_length_615_cov_17.590106_g5615_i0.p1 GENE.NODE_6018_length_615_cov_17.590106_g5615_i0~~NODE_6018_length_615_cov_17.590106_g5615_i0.p1  ORF type:complete len:121 (-),score=9.59 NODE_6018_length_615_cov_17.590106_g5615_i0:32-394(-)